MDVIKACIPEDGTLDLQCPTCGNSRRIPVSELKIQEHTYRIKCRCGTSHYIELNRRKFVRKDVALKGVYSTGNKMNDEIMDIVNLSKMGLCFSTYNTKYLAIDQIIHLRLVLDNSEREPIECKSIIKWISDGKVGVEFIDLSPSMQTRLGWCLLS